MLRRLLLPPLLVPLLAVLLVGALNPQPAVRLRLLTWTSPPLPIGLWIALAGAGGAAVSAGATTLALGAGGAPLRRQVWRRGSTEVAEPWEEGRREEAEPERVRAQARERPPADWAAVGGSRAPGEPAPIVSVPYRVVRRAAATAPVEASAPASGGRSRTEAVPEPVPVGDDWGATASDDW